MQLQHKMIGCFLTLFAVCSPLFASPVDPEKDLSLVLIPWPCPSEESYKGIYSNMNAIIHTLPVVLHFNEEKSCDVIVVKAPYASEENLDFDSNDWWFPQIREFEKEMAMAESTGLVRFVDTVPKDVHSEWN